MAVASGMTRVSRAALGLSGIALLGGLMANASVRADDVSPHALLEHMNDAVRMLDYEGRFVVQVGDRLDALYIVHRVDGGNERERVYSLTGSEREMVRDGQAVACPVPGRDHRVNVGRRAHGRSFSPLSGMSSQQLAASYDMELLAPGRVAGRDAEQILVRPRDDLRYGYRLYIDRETALPLRSVMFDENRHPVSQMMFVDLKTGPDVQPIGPAETPAPAPGIRPPPPSFNDRLARPAWTFADLPPGFQLNVHRRRPLADVEGESEHFIFSDGLATVSVYIQPLSGDALVGESSLGVAQAVGRVLDDSEIIVVGEVPLKTLHWFAEHVQATHP